MIVIAFAIVLILLLPPYIHGSERNLIFSDSSEEQVSVSIKPAWMYIIGIDKYRNVQQLSTAVNDAMAIKDLMSTKYQFSPERLIERYDAEATRERIIEDFYQLAGKVGKDDSLFIYYAGHGVDDSRMNQGYWVPVDGRPGRVSSYISNADVRTALAGIPARHIWLVSDSCFSGSLLADRAIGDAITDRYYSEKSKLPSRLIMTSGGNEPVADSTGARGCERHSVFACYFLKYLKSSTQPYLTPTEIFSAIARTISINSDQTPILGALRKAGHENGEFVLQNTNYSGISAVDSANIEHRAADRSQLEKLKKQALERESQKKKYSDDLVEYYAEVMNLDGISSLTAQEKIAAWEGFLSKFPKSHSLWGPNPHLGNARDRLAFWRTESSSAVDSATSSAPVSQSGKVVIEGGCFTMGNGEGSSEEKPAHEVCISDFYIDVSEVSNQAFADFVGNHGNPLEGEAHWFDPNAASSGIAVSGNIFSAVVGQEDYPVTDITWYGARSYCRKQEGDLPTEAQWEFIAHQAERNNAGSSRAGAELTKVNAGGVNSRGLYNLPGNATEWVLDSYDPNFYSISWKQDPANIDQSKMKSARGFDRLTKRPSLSITRRLRFNSTTTLSTLGFRCAYPIK
jgi:formylglycine-generating enzyme required for sulfatase activity